MMGEWSGEWSGDQSQMMRSRSPALVPPPSRSQHVTEVGALEAKFQAGINERDAIIERERRRHREEIGYLNSLMAASDAVLNKMQADLVAAKQDQVAFATLQQQLAEASNVTRQDADKLQALTSKEEVNQQRVKMLTETIDKERKKTAAIESALAAERRDRAENAAGNQKLLRDQQVEVEHLVAQLEAKDREIAARDREVAGRGRSWRWL